MNLTLMCSQAEARWRALRAPAANVHGAAPGERAPGFGAILLGWVGTMLAVGAVAGLLWAFHSVVLGSMAKAETRRAAAVQSELAAWRCARVGSRAAREACTAQIGPVVVGYGAPSQ